MLLWIFFQHTTRHFKAVQYSQLCVLHYRWETAGSSRKLTSMQNKESWCLKLNNTRWQKHFPTVPKTFDTKEHRQDCHQSHFAYSIFHSTAFSVRWQTIKTWDIFFPLAAELQTVHFILALPLSCSNRKTTRPAKQLEFFTIKWIYSKNLIIKQCDNQ